MIGAIILLSIGIYTSITIILLMFIELNMLPIDVNENGILKLFGWPIYFPLWFIYKILCFIKKIIMFLYCDILIKGLDKLVKKA